MTESDVLRIVVSVQGHAIRIPAKQWVHVIESHDYMAGNLDKVVETIAEPSRII
jgi:hypothetical protein